MEVFIGFGGNLEAVPFLEASLEAWSKVRFADPQVIEVPPNEKFDVRLRVLADKLAKDDYYLLADIDAVPEDAYVVSSIQKMLAARSNVGMAFIRPLFDVGGRVRVLRKGVVERWPEPQERRGMVIPTYDQQHAEAIVLAGKLVETWEDVHYRNVPSLIEIVN